MVDSGETEIERGCCCAGGTFAFLDCLGMKKDDNLLSVRERISSPKGAGCRNYIVENSCVYQGN